MKTNALIFGALGVMALLVLIGIVFATTTSLTVQSCANRGGTVTITNCLGLNTSDNNADVTVAKNGILGTTMSNFSGGTVNSVATTFRHSGQSGIGGTVGVTFYDGLNNVAFCSEDSSVSNTTTYTTSTVTACTPSGGWDTTKLNNLEIRLKNKDTGGSQNMLLSYVAVNVDYNVPQTCGNNIIEGTETCDGSALNSQTCQTQGFSGGTLSCNGTCTGFVTTSCYNQTCGNNIIEGTEVCDGNALNSQTCQTQGFTYGTLACNGSCTAFNTNNCSNQLCGNSIVEGTEVCDLNNLNGQTCSSQGFSGGTLKCKTSCLVFDTNSCF